LDSNNDYGTQGTHLFTCYYRINSARNLNIGFYPNVRVKTNIEIASRVDRV